jgi:serine dehydrogenase proteinase
VFVPQAAMSAATMLACASDEIVMGKHSSLGPIDPQFLVTTASGTSAVPAQAVIDQFEMALGECADPAKLGAWAPILPQYGPALLIQCVNALELAEDLAAQWLRTWMFAGMKYGPKKARAIARKLADHTKFKSHGRPIHRDAAVQMGLKISKLEDSQELQDLVLSVFHAYMHTFAGTIAVKIIENHRGQAFVKFQPVFQGIQLQQMPAQPSPAPPATDPPPTQ